MGGRVKTLLRRIQRWVEAAAGDGWSTPRVTVVQHRRATHPLAPGLGRPRTFVSRTPRPYWEERDWRRDGHVYHGAYHTRHGSWSGRVTVSPAGRVEVFIKNPPKVLARHPHWNCFNQRDGGWFFVHPVTPVADVSAGIIAVEKTIDEAYAL